MERLPVRIGCGSGFEGWRQPSVAGSQRAALFYRRVFQHARPSVSSDRLLTSRASKQYENGPHSISRSISSDLDKTMGVASASWRELLSLGAAERLGQKLAKDQPGEYGVTYKVAPPQAAGFAGEPVQPFQSGLLHPVRSAASAAANV